MQLFLRARFLATEGLAYRAVALFLIRLRESCDDNDKILWWLRR